MGNEWSKDLYWCNEFVDKIKSDVVFDTDDIDKENSLYTDDKIKHGNCDKWKKAKILNDWGVSDGS